MLSLPLCTLWASPGGASLRKGLFQGPLENIPFALLPGLPGTAVKTTPPPPRRKQVERGRGVGRREAAAEPRCTRARAVPSKPGQPHAAPDYYPSETGKAHTWGHLLGVPVL